MGQKPLIGVGNALQPIIKKPGEKLKELLNLLQDQLGFF